jgi:peptide subunit release factor RF-3
MDAERLAAIKARLTMAPPGIWREDITTLLGMVGHLQVECVRLQVQNLRLTSELDLARVLKAAAVTAARWERATTGESR